jgi:hypothetical protein
MNCRFLRVAFCALVLDCWLSFQVSLAFEMNIIDLAFTR